MRLHFVFPWRLCRAPVLVGCSSSSESASRDTLTADVGKYEAAPRASPSHGGVPAFNVTAGRGFSQAVI